MDFDTLLAQISELLQRQGRVSYGALKRRFNLDDDYLQDLKDELIGAQRLAVDEDGKILVWIGDLAVASSQLPVASSSQLPTLQTLDSGLPTPDARRSEGERRQLTVMFCDLVGSTALSTQLDPEDWHAVVRTYQQTCAEVIQRYEGYVAQYLGDGLLVYFGYPAAHEDDAVRAVRAGLEIVTALQQQTDAGHQVPSPLAGEGQGEGAKVSTVPALTPYPGSFDFAQDRLSPQRGKGRTLQAVGWALRAQHEQRWASHAQPNLPLLNLTERT
jgi:hypothetical protein